MTWALRDMTDISALLQELECVFYGKISSLDWERGKVEMVRTHNVFCRTGALEEIKWVLCTHTHHLGQIIDPSATPMGTP